jgi:hypothetical protein
MWGGFTATRMLINNMFDERPLGITIVDGGFEFVSTLAMSAVIGFMGT